MRQNKAASQSAAKASSSAQNECAAKLKAAQERIQELLVRLAGHLRFEFDVIVIASSQHILQGCLVPILKRQEGIHSQF